MNNYIGMYIIIESEEQMSVLIKGIDMPKEPWDCPCHNGETGQCKVINIGCYDYIPKNCPLVSVQTPHGDLIDVEEVDRSLSAHVTLRNDPKEDWKHIYEAIEAVQTIIESED